MLANYTAGAGAEAEGNRGKELLFTQFSRDLLVVNEYLNVNNLPGKSEVDNGDDEGEEGLELSLGLSLNGRFGVDPKKAKMKLMRSSSVSTLVFCGVGRGSEESLAPVVPIAAYAPLSRTYSLPTETEQEWRKRKELQSLRRMEAKRRRMDKIKSVRVGRDKVDSEENSGEENGSNANDSSNGQGLDSINGNGNLMPSSQGSIGSQGSGSSGLSEFESQPIQVNKNNEARSPSSIHKEQKPQVIPGSLVDKTADKGAKEAKEMLKNVMLDMPCVSTTGNGPNGKKINGFLYTYGKGEEVRIVCVCHGSFLSPAEFVKHAGGTEVEHPLRHIVVNRSPLL